MFQVFNKNFFKDWRKVMTAKEREKIVDLSKCDFTEIDAYFKKVWLAQLSLTQFIVNIALYSAALPLGLCPRRHF